MKNKILLIIIGIFLIGVISAIPIPSPHGFYGTVDYSNGLSLEEGTIITQIDNLTVGSCEIVNGAYDLVVESEYGGVIYFYLEGKSEVLETFVFKAFEVTELNFIIEIPEPPIQNETTQKKSKSISNIEDWGLDTCEPNWECTGWSGCYSRYMIRNCQDTNNCAYSYNKPIEKTGCETTLILEEERAEQASISFKKSYEPKNLLATINWILLITIFVLLITIFFLRKR